jgi:hypothetical protein
MQSMAHLAKYICERCGGTGQQEAGTPCPLGWGYSDRAGTCDRCKGLRILGNVTVAQDVPLVEEINWLAEDAFCAVYRIGTAEKYPEIFATKNDDTLILRDSAGKLSSITFACAKGLIAETARYGVRVVAFKQAIDLQEARPAWRCPQEGATDE